MCGFVSLIQAASAFLIRRARSFVYRLATCPGPGADPASRGPSPHRTVAGA